MRRLLIIFASWTFVAFFFAAHISLGSAALGRPEPFLRALTAYMICAVAWTAFTPLILRISARFRIAAPNVVAHVAVHVLASIAFMLVSFALVALTVPKLVGGPFADWTFLGGIKALLATQLHLELLRYWAVVAIEHLLVASQLRAELAEARLEVLRRQLQPHFLFNTLNSISVLMFENVAQANRMLLRLSELLRAGLTADSPHEVSLEHELSFLQRYLDIERIRFGERLTVEVDVDPSTLGARVPNLILQPLVENAIRYGVAAVDRPSKVAIHAQRDGRELRLHVRDDGPGLARNAKRGVGLSNTEARLRQLYGSAQRMELTTPENGGVLVSIAIPFRDAAAV